MPTIAIIDDNPDSRDILQAMLGNEGHTTESFTSGKDFVASFKRDAFKLILMDLSMPDMDGYELLATVRREDPNVPILAVTARAYDLDRKQADAAGFSDF